MSKVRSEVKSEKREKEQSETSLKLGHFLRLRSMLARTLSIERIRGNVKQKVSRMRKRI